MLMILFAQAHSQPSTNDERGVRDFIARWNAAYTGLDAGALAALARHDEAIKQFDDVVKRAGSGSIYGRMARLGKADTQARAGQVDAAIVTWKEMAASTTGEFPVDAILMELARAYAQKGEKEEARKTFSQLIDQHPNSPYTSEARTELENLKS